MRNKSKIDGIPARAFSHSARRHCRQEVTFCCALARNTCGAWMKEYQGSTEMYYTVDVNLIVEALRDVTFARARSSRSTLPVERYLYSTCQCSCQSSGNR